MAESHQALVTLPNELLATIAQALARDDLLAMRLACRKIADAVDYVFIDCFPTHRTHLYSKRGLKTLVDITATPRLAKRLRFVRLVCFQFGSLHDLDRYSELGDAYAGKACPSDADSDHEDFGIPVSTALTKQQCEQQEALMKAQERRRAIGLAWEVWKAEHSALLSSDGDVALLTEAFQHWGLNGQSCDIWLEGHFPFGCHCNKAPDTFRVRHAKAVLGPMAQVCTCSFASQSCHRAARATLIAMAESSLMVVDLNLCERGSCDGISGAAFEIPSDTFLKLLPRTECVKSFQVDFGKHADYEVWQGETANRLTDMLGAMTNLEDLYIAASGGSEADYFREEGDAEHLLAAVESMRLESLWFREMQILPQQLMKRLGRWKGSLRYLKLDECYIPSVEQWEPVLTFIATEMRLKGVILWSLGQGLPQDGGLTLYDCNGEDVPEYRGKGAVREGLAKLVREARYMDHHDGW